jgi:hypothetical protein
MSEVDRIVEVLRERFPSVPPSTDEVWSQSPAAKVIDCVLSLNRHYDTIVVPRVQRFVHKHPDIKGLVHLRQLISSYASAMAFSSAELDYKDQKRANTLLGVVEHLIDAEQDHDGATESDRLKRWAEWARPGDYLAVGVPGFGLAGFQYLRMLFGAQTAKPDVHVIRFVSDAVGHQVTDVRALYLLERAAKSTGLSIRDLDTAIWNSGARPAAQSEGRTKPVQPTLLPFDL